MTRVAGKRAAPVQVAHRARFSQSPEGAPSSSLSGSLLVYSDGRDVHQLTFARARVTWSCIEGPFAGETGSAPYHAASVDKDTLLIVWSPSRVETSVIVANFRNGAAHVCHLYGSECTIVVGRISRWAPGAVRTTRQRRAPGPSRKRRNTNKQGPARP